MKKLLRLIIACAIIIGITDTASAEFRWGPTAGVSIGTLKFKQDLMEVNQIVGPQAGVTAEMMFPGIGFGIDFSGIYSMQGAKLHLDQKPIWAIDGYGTQNSLLHTLSIPVNVRFKWTRMDGLEDYVAPYVFGGPVFNLTLAHNKLKAMEYAGGAIGLQVGLGGEFYKHWQLQASYVWGMTYVEKAVKLQNFSARNSYWTVRATYLF